MNSKQSITPFIRGCGLALVVGGALTILINLTLTPLLVRANIPPAVVPTTQLFFLRQSTSGLAALLIIFGCLGVGLHLRQRAGSGVGRTFAFLAAFIGSCFVLAVEFCDVFVLRSVAQANGDTFMAIDKNPFMNIGMLSGVGLFAVGWLFLSGNLWRLKVLPRWAALATFLGLILIPCLQAPFGVVGAMLGNTVFGSGLIGLGWKLRKID
jgi:hypothetical protein